ncbi:hypothetical protein [Streptomyces sp. NPDC051636]|uniref:hypothetical protein n=1 Tax=Streptomyces sp. NPDC051636 TaxID=3365663 RepID=UPI0037B0DE3E
MDLVDRYQALYRGALLVAESADDAYRLDALERFLKPWVRGRLDRLRGLLESCDNRRELAEDTRRLASTAAEYSRLRDALFSDVHHTGPEPPWRIVEAEAFAIRAQSGVLLEQPTFVLQRLAAVSDVPGAATWEFTVIGNPSDPGDMGSSFVVMVSTEDHPGGVPVQVAKELESNRSWYQQLEYGFYALGIKPFLPAIYDPDRHRK